GGFRSRAAKVPFGRRVALGDRLRERRPATGAGGCGSGGDRDFQAAVLGKAGQHLVYRSKFVQGVQQSLRLAEALREELWPLGVAVTLVSPGVVDTAFFERRKVPYERQRPQLMTAQAAANAIADAVELRRDDVVIPQWLSFPALLKANL